MERASYVETGGARLHVVVDGEPSKPWIVLSNSLACTLESWRFQVPVLAEHYRVLRYDTRGHGKSSTPAGPYDFDKLVGDLVGLMDAFDIENADVMGLSMGGMTMLGLATSHPARVRRVICCDARADAVPPFVESWNARIAAIREAGGVSAVLEFSLERWFTEAFRRANPEILALAKSMILSTSAEGYIACAEALKQLDFKRQLHAIAVPALFVCGAQDSAAAPAVMREMSTLVPQGIFAEVDPGAHICSIENPSAFNATVLNWLERTGETSQRV